MIDRIKLLMEQENLSNSAFSDEIELQRSSLSHILSGRNKPSLDFVMKVKKRFLKVNTDWLIFGEGKMYLDIGENVGEKETPDFDLFSSSGRTSIPNETKTTEQFGKNEIKTDDHNEISAKSSVNDAVAISEEENVSPSDSNTRLPVKVLLLYNNGTFEVFKQ